MTCDGLPTMHAVAFFALLPRLPAMARSNSGRKSFEPGHAGRYAAKAHPADATHGVAVIDGRPLLKTLPPPGSVAPACHSV